MQEPSLLLSSYIAYLFLNLFLALFLFCIWKGVKRVFFFFKVEESCVCVSFTSLVGRNGAQGRSSSSPSANVSAVKSGPEVLSVLFLIQP